MLSCRVSTSMQQAHRPVFRWSRRIIGENRRFTFFVLSFGERMSGEGRVRRTHRGSFLTCVSDSLCDAGRYHHQCLLHRLLLLYTPDPARFTSSVNPEERGQELNSKQSLLKMRTHKLMRNSLRNCSVCQLHPSTPRGSAL